MSQTVEIEMNASPAQQPARVRKPTLIAKYSKSMSLAYWICQELRDKNVISDEAGFQSSLAAIGMWGSVEDQTAFYQRFIDSSSETGKSMRRVIALHNKPVKAKKAAKDKTAKTSTKEGNAVAQTDGDGTKRGRKKKEVAVSMNNNENIIAQIIAAANGTDEIVEIAYLNAAPVDPVEVTAPVVAVAPAQAAAEKPKRKPAVKKTKTDVAATTTTSTNAIETVEPVVASSVVEIAAAPASGEGVATKARKPATVKKTKAVEPVVVATAVTEPVTEPVAEPATVKKTKAVGKAKASEAVVASTTVTVATGTVATGPVTEPATKQRKPAVKKTAAAVVPAPVTVPEAVVERPSTPILTEELEAEEEEEEEEIQARRVKYNGIEYLVDQNNKAYDPTEFNHIGTYSENGTITLF